MIDTEHSMEYNPDDRDDAGARSLAMQELATVPPDVVHNVVPNTVNPRTRGLIRGNKDLPKIRKPPLHERTSIALGGMFGKDVQEVAYCVATAVKLGTMSAMIGRMILERVLPASRPVQLDLPEMKGPQDVIEAENKIVAAMNAGQISPAEARTLQAWAKSAYRARRIANVDMRGRS